MQTQPPWEVHPDLGHERLAALLTIISSARSGAVKAHKPTLEDGWSLGCVANSRTRKAIAKAQQAYPWLKVTTFGLRFEFCVGNVPFRFYRGPAHKPNHRTLQRSYTEFNLLRFAFPDVQDAEHMWRLAIHTEGDGSVNEIVVVRVTKKGTPVYHWIITALEAASATGTLTTPLAPITSMLPESVELPPPLIIVPRTQKKVADDDSEK